MSLADLSGIPVIKSNLIPRGRAYIFNENGAVMIYGIGWRRPTVTSIIASQRRRRHRT